MAGFILNGYVGRIPCPHCGSTDCAGLRVLGSLTCVRTGKRVTESQLEKMARKHKIKRIEKRRPR